MIEGDGLKFAVEEAAAVGEAAVVVDQHSVLMNLVVNIEQLQTMVVVAEAGVAPER